MDEKLKRDIILDNYQNPTNRGLVDTQGYIRVNTRNSSCVDNIDVMAKLENGIFIDIRFDGEACAISTSATSIMIKTLIGKNIEEVKYIIDNYEKMINEEPYDKDLLGELVVYDTISKQPSRKKCAALPFESIKKIIEQANM
ncbi:MAG: SUF system NifU family Fe-S cluster assembly protein [Bacilli bacterium]|nr:SUF system NifU family Fe-S cluster assembly protein [Bacilli bacterium]